jgi:hypothetical protein
MGTRAEAVKLGLSHYCTGKPCVNGHIDIRRVKDRVCTACDRLHKARKAKADPIWKKNKARATYVRTRSTILANKQIYRQQNKGKLAALNAARKKHIKQRTPKWISKEERWLIKEIYELAALRTKMFGFAWHVDHIIPLQGDVVSGLHVPINLQVIPGVENIRKRNSFVSI